MCRPTLPLVPLSTTFRCIVVRRRARVEVLRSRPRTSPRSDRPDGDELLVRSQLDDPAVVDDHDAVGPHGGGQAVGDDDRGASLEHARRAPASTCVSDLRSRFDVASSSTSTAGLARNARASATSWRSPDDSDDAALVHRRCRDPRAAVDEVGEPDALDRLARPRRRWRPDGRTRCCRGASRRTGTAPGAPRRAGGAASRS